MHNGLSPKNKLKGLAALSQTGAEIRETSDGTTLITSGDTWETSDETTLLSTDGQPVAKIEMTFVP